MEPAQLFRWNNARQPYVLATQTISDNFLTVHVLNDMDAISQIHRDKIGWFSLVTLLELAMLLLVAGALHHYRNLLQQRRQQEQMLKRLKESNERSTVLFNANHDEVIMLDGERLVSIDCNPQALTMLGATNKEESLGLPP
jgi:PAS domain-containing protein